VFCETKGALEAAGYTITDTHHAVGIPTEEGSWDHYFGLMDLLPTHGEAFGHDGAAAGSNGDFKLIAGVRNAHNKRFSYGFCAGARVMVCDNLAFHGEIMAHRRHTKHIENDLSEVIRRAVQCLQDTRGVIASRHEDYKAAQLTEELVNDTVVRSWREYEAIPKSLADGVLDQFWTPDHKEHEAFDTEGQWSMWRLYNAFTTTLKGRTGMPSLSMRTMALHRLLDRVAEKQISI